MKGLLQGNLRQLEATAAQVEGVNCQLSKAVKFKRVSVSPGDLFSLGDLVRRFTQRMDLRERSGVTCVNLHFRSVGVTCVNLCLRPQDLRA